MAITLQFTLLSPVLDSDYQNQGDCLHWAGHSVGIYLYNTSSSGLSGEALLMSVFQSKTLRYTTSLSVTKRRMGSVCRVRFCNIGRS